MTRTTRKLGPLGLCQITKRNGDKCEAAALMTAHVAWENENKPGSGDHPVCGSHAARLKRKLGSGVTFTKPPSQAERILEGSR